MVKIYGISRFVNEKTTAIQRTVKILPKTGTQVIKFMNNEKLMSKVVIPGRGNVNSRFMTNLITNFKDGQPYKFSINYIKRPYKGLSDYYVSLFFLPKYMDLKNKWKSVFAGRNYFV